jgi:CheY-like chemotaxis protein
MSDPMMLRRILQNLLANAVQYTERGAVMLAARRRGPNVRIEVWDTGPGIPQAERQLIFEEFQRGPAAHRQDIGGFGLGLSIVKRMGDALQHPISICSHVGHGTLFMVSAPFAATVDTHTMENPKAGSSHPYGLSGAKILIIDNDAAVLDAMQSLLERWSCETRAVPDLAALDSLIGEGFRPDIVLADYHLNNGQCGLNAVERLRSEFDPQLPAVVVTADHAPMIADRVHAAACEILLKPVKPAELRALMVHLLA